MTSTFGAAILAARERAGLTQGELAKRVGTSPGAIARYESDRVCPRLEIVRRRVEACGCELRIEVAPASPQRRAAADAALARSVEDRLRTNDAFTRFAAQLRDG